MAFQLRIDEMLSALVCDSRSSKVPEFVARSNALADEMAQEVAKEFRIRAGQANHDLGLTCVPFYPLEPGAPLPAALADFDNEEEFIFEEGHIDG